MRLLLLLLVVLASVAGGDSDQLLADRAAARTLYAKAVPANEVWTALQLESWARSSTLALGAILGQSDIIGDPLFAVPHNIFRYRDRGATIAVIAHQSYYQFASTGRPLSTPVKLGFSPQRAGISADGNYIGILTTESSRITTVNCEIRHIPSGTRVLSLSEPLHDQEYVSSEPEIAADGTAIGFQITSQVSNERRVVILRSGGAPLHFDKAREINNVGSQGTWSVVNEDGRVWRRDNRPNVALIDSAAVHGGHVLLTKDLRLLLVPPAGPEQVIPLPLVLGKNPNVEALGDWLVVHSGDGALTAPGRDGLDRETAGGEALPPTMLWWYMPRLASGQLSPDGQRPAPWSICRLRAAAFYAWSGDQAEIVDLDNGVSQLPAFGGSIQRVENDGSNLFVRVRHDNLLISLLDARLRVVFTAECTDVNAQSWQHALFTVGSDQNRTFHVALLHPETDKRKVVKLACGPGNWGVDIDQHARRIVAVDWTQKRWVELNPSTGAVHERGQIRAVGGDPIPRTNRFHSASGGRYMAWGPRLIDKRDGGVVLTANNLRPADAWRVGATTVFTTQDFKAGITGRKASDIIALGFFREVESAPTLAFSDKGGIAFVSDRIPVGSLVVGPALDQKNVPSKSIDLPNQVWNIRGNTFSNGGVFHWDEDLCGIPVQRLRGAGPDRLTAINGALIINLDPNVVARVASRGR